MFNNGLNAMPEPKEDRMDYIDVLIAETGFTRAEVLKSLEELHQHNCVLPLSDNWGDGVWLTHHKKAVGVFV